MNQKCKKTYLQIALQEPFRIFFPIGVAVALLGVALWPLFHWQYLNFYPGFIHARLEDRFEKLASVA